MSDAEKRDTADLEAAEREIEEIGEISEHVLPFTLGTTILYAVLFVIGLAWSLGASYPLLPDRLGPGLLVEIGAGAVVGFLAVLFVGVLWRRTRLFERLEAQLADKLGALSTAQIVRLALLSSVAEEVFFRGALQPFFSSLLGFEGGYIVTSLVFGILHGSSRSFWAWTIFATACGFILGGAYALTGHVVTPMVIHFIINAVNMLRIVRRERSESAGGREIV